MPRLLFIRYKKSNKIFEGGEQASQKNFDALSSILGAENIDVEYIHDEQKGHSIWDYIKGVFFLPFGYYFGLTPSRVNSIVKRADSYDYLFIDRSVFGILAKKAKSSACKAKVIAFFHNVEKIYFGDKISKKAPWRALVVRCADRNDSFCCRFADKIIALNERDRGIIEKMYGRKADELLPIMFKDKYDRESYPQGETSTKPSCLFLGAYFAANNEGIEWFVRNVYPKVNVKLSIVGKGMNKIKSCNWITPDITVVGDAPELESYFEATDIMILPIFKGSGMKVKTCESLMYGKNIIGTDEAFEGYELDYKKVGGKCNTAEEFISLIKDFENRPRPRFNEYSRKIFLEKYSDNLAKDVILRVL